jgi:transposase-like protein
MPGGRPTTYKPEYCERVIELGKEGKSRVQIAVELDVPRASLHDWAEAHPKFSAALTRAKECEQNWWETKGQQALDTRDFNAPVWKKSMEARFRDDYTERRQVEQDIKAEVAVTDLSGKLAELDALIEGKAQD